MVSTKCTEGTINFDHLFSLVDTLKNLMDPPTFFEPLPSPSRMPCMSNSPTELHKHPSGCGQRWGSGGPERKAETEPNTAPDNSPSHPTLCRLSAPLPPYAHEPKGGGAGQPSDPSGGGSRRDAVRNPCILTAPNKKSDTTLLVSLSP